MSDFGYTEEEKRRSKILKYNLSESLSLLHDEALQKTRTQADHNIESSKKLLELLGYDTSMLDKNVKTTSEIPKENPYKKHLKSEAELYLEAEKAFPEEVHLEDILSPEQISTAWAQRNEIEAKFSKQTGIINPIDLKFLILATAFQITKSLIFPYVSKSFHYGEKIDLSTRMDHNDPKIKQEEKAGKKAFKAKHEKQHEKGKWINLLFQTPPYDITKGSAALKINMGGKYHRLPTLGHDPILGWIFGTIDILTDVITLTDFSSYRVVRNPTMRITNVSVDLPTLFYEGYLIIKDDYFNLPAALFAQYCHLKSDISTKLGLPIPLLTVFNKNLATKLYREQYDFLCFSRDLKIVGVSFAVSVIIDMIIGLLHQFYRLPEENEELYEVRTRKILLMSSFFASTSTVAKTMFTKNYKGLDIGQLLNLCCHLFLDPRFILTMKQEFIQNEIDKQFQQEYEHLKKVYLNL